MRNNTKILIAILIVLFGVSYLVLQNNRNNTPQVSEQFLISELQKEINDVSTIIISQSNQIITLNKQDDIWKIAEAENFLADANKIATFLLGLREFRLKQQKTSNPNNYAKLGLGIDSVIKIVLKKDNVQFADVSIGKAALHAQGTYVRNNDDPQTWLATGILDVQLGSKDWIVNTIIDVDASGIKTVSFTPATTAGFSITKATPNDQDFTLKQIPENMQLQQGFDLNALATGLQKFNIETASPLSEISVDKKTMTVDYQLFSGMNYQLNLFKDDDKHLLTLKTVNANSDQVKQLENWQFVLPKFKYDALHKSLADLIEEIPATVATEKKD